MRANGWLQLALACGASLPSCLAAGGFTALGSPSRSEPSEDARIAVNQQLHGEWPPSKRYPGGTQGSDTEGWHRRMDEREELIRNSPADHTQWELWLDLAQMRFIKNFTPTGWHHSTLDPATHAEVVARFAETQKDATSETNAGNLATLYIDGDREYWNWQQHLPKELQQRILNNVRAELAAWTGLADEEIEFTMAYGARIYRNNSVLREHVDVLETHVLSAVYCIAIEGEEKDQEPWYLGGFPDLNGDDSKVDLRPGQLFLYESAKVPHGRPGMFRGDKYAAIFIHFRPKGWNLVGWDRIYMLPPGWSEPKRRHEL